MGRHYVPQEYLRGFAAGPERTHICMFDLKQEQWSRPAIKKAAQQGGYYADETEERLAREIEIPGNVALRVLRDGGSLSRQQREDLGNYVAVLLMRGPRKRRMGYEGAKPALDNRSHRTPRA